MVFRQKGIKKILKAEFKKSIFLAFKKDYNKTFTKAKNWIKHKYLTLISQRKKYSPKKEIQKFNLFLVDYKKRIRFFQEFKKAFILKFLLRQKSIYFQRRMTITILKKKKAAANNAYNGNSSHSVVTACMRGRCRQLKKKKKTKAKANLKIETSSFKEEENSISTKRILKDDYK